MVNGRRLGSKWTGEVNRESVDDFERVEQIDAPRVVRAVAVAGGPRLELREALGGGAVGAWVVRLEDGHESVLTWSPPLRPGQRHGAFDRAVAMMDLAASVGVPVPRYEAVVPLADGGVAIVQTRVSGVVPDLVGPALVDHLLDLVACRRGLVVGTSFAGEALPLYLRSDGPAFCLHGPLRAFSASTAALLDVIEATVEDDDDVLDGIDAVHLDFHVGNVLVDPAKPERVAAVVDWGGAAPGQVELDLAILAFDLTWRAPGPIQQRVERHLLDTTEPRLFAKLWAHASLRLLDWTIRHVPHDVDHWTSVARRHLST